MEQMARKQARYTWVILALTLAYLAALYASKTVGSGGSGPWHVAIALFPLLPIFAALFVIYRQYTQMDEYRRLLMLQSYAIGFAVAAFTYFALPQLQEAGLLPDISAKTALLFPMMSGVVVSIILSLRGCWS